MKPGEKVPADGEVVDGETSVNESMLTGESTPVTKKRGATGHWGRVNGEGAITVAGEEDGQGFVPLTGDRPRQAGTGEQVTDAGPRRPCGAGTRHHRPCSVGGITFLVWQLLINTSVDFSLERAVTVMVIACPHALGLAIPLVVAISTALGAQNGLLVRNRAAFEQARNIQAIIFDKTGTLTEGRFGVTDVLTFTNDLDEHALLRTPQHLKDALSTPLHMG